jgi:hypothetical protein
MDTLTRLHASATAQPALRLFTVIVRVLLALAFVPSGLIKILDQPFTTLPVSDPVGYFFAGFFSAHGYYRFVGAAQWTAAALLLTPWTATLGAFVYLPIITNIFAITLAIGPAFYGTRVVTGLMFLADIYLIAWDWDRWKAVLPAAAPVRARHGDFMTSFGLLIAAAGGLWSITQVHLARLRHDSYTASLAMVVAMALLGLAMLVSGYRRANR